MPLGGEGNPMVERIAVADRRGDFFNSPRMPMPRGGEDNPVVVRIAVADWCGAFFNWSVLPMDNIKTRAGCPCPF